VLWGRDVLVKKIQREGFGDRFRIWKGMVFGARLNYDPIRITRYEDTLIQYIVHYSSLGVRNSTTAVVETLACSRRDR